MNRIAFYLLPLILFLGLCVFLYQGLFSDPKERGSTALAKTFPTFSLPDLMDESIIYDNTVFDGQVTLINVWGVWCVTCAIELPYLESLKDEGYRIVGLYYDQDLDPDFGTKTIQRVRSEVVDMLGKYGDPYAFNIFDVYRETSLDLGVTGAPETFLVDQQGVIRVHHLGDLNERVWRNKFVPVLADIKSLTSDNGLQGIDDGAAAVELELIEDGVVAVEVELVKGGAVAGQAEPIKDGAAAGQVVEEKSNAVRLESNAVETKTSNQVSAQLFSANTRLAGVGE